jgi:hypothetical protein
MAKVSFVGFQEKVEIPEGFQLLKIEERLESSLNKDQLFSLLSDVQKLSSWINQVLSFDSRPGGKLIFGDGSAATCTSFVLGKEVSFIADSFGNLTAKIIKEKDHNSITINFAILTDLSEKKKEEILAIITRLKAQL